MDFRLRVPFLENKGSGKIGDVCGQIPRHVALVVGQAVEGDDGGQEAAVGARDAVAAEGERFLCQSLRRLLKRRPPNKGIF